VRKSIHGMVHVIAPDIQSHCGVRRKAFRTRDRIGLDRWHLKIIGEYSRMMK